MNRRAVVTGANRGIGLEVARGLVRVGFDVTLVTRTEQAGRLALEAMKEGDSNSDSVHAELDDLEAVRRLGRRLLEGPPLALLVHNAGVWPSARKLTVDGLEQAFVVNHLTPFLLTHLLEPHLVPGGRVVQVSAGLAVKGRVDLERTPRGDDFSSLWTYATTKLCNLALVPRWAQRLAAREVTCNALHPGVIRTGLGDRRGLVGALLRFAKRRWKSPEEGAAPVVRLGVSPDVEGLTGAYFDEERQVELPAIAADAQLAARLWDQAATLCGVAPA